MRALIAERRDCRARRRGAGATPRARHPGRSTSSTCSATSRSRKLQPLKVVVNAGNGGAGLDHRRARAAPAVRVHQGAPRARRHFPERRAQPDARGEPRQRPSTAMRAQRRRCRARLGRRFRPLLLLRRARRRSSRATTSWACWPRCSCSRSPGARIVHDPRLTWNTLDIVRRLRRRRRCCRKSGHAFIKQKHARGRRASTAAR